MFFSITIEEDSRALLFRNGVIVGYLFPGRRRRIGWARWRAEVFDLGRGVMELRPEAGYERWIPPSEGTVLEVPADHAALVERHGRPCAILRPGRYVVWNLGAQPTVALVDLRPLASAIPAAFRHLAAEDVLFEVCVHEHERALLFADGARERVLDPGRHAFSPWQRRLRVERVDIRERELQVVGQELVTRDKVSLRINLLLKYRVVDPVLATSAVDDLHDALYAEVQLAARNVVAGVSVDQLLEERVALADDSTARVQARAEAWGVRIARVDIKDVVLPGEMKTLLNRVIEAEKRAQAQVILRREEVAATRSLANTARLLENNPVLLRLKEIEALKEVVERIPQLTVIVGSDELVKHLRLPQSGST